MTTKYFHDCQVERTKRVRTGSLTANGPKFDSEADVVEACGTPLFSDDECKRGICKSCLRGWEVEGNRPTEKGRQMIQAGRVIVG